MTERKFLPVPAEHQQQVSSSVLKLFDLRQSLDETIQIVNNIAVSLKAGLMEPPVELGSVVLLDNMDKELCRLLCLPKYHGMIGRRLFIQEVWRITAMIFISVICRLHQINPRIHNNMSRQLLLDGLQITADDYSSFLQTLICCFTDKPNQLDLLMTIAIRLTLDDWGSIKLRLLSFLLSSEICRGPVQDTWRRRLTSSHPSIELLAEICT